MSYPASLILVVATLAACAADPAPDDPASATQSSTETTQGPDPMESSSSSGPSPEVLPTDCDALPDEEACNAVQGADFACTWIPDVYPVQLDGETCSIGEPIGWCVVEYQWDTGCADEPAELCPEGEPLPPVHVREVENGPTLMLQGSVSGESCGDSPDLWAPCNDEGSHPACTCACDPGLPS